ncbi:MULTISPECIES: type II toxin-antitoxin system VapC family toxin [Actinomyces]|uniref:Type II toxin-antitoxin system VapC family toxin n=1 Tax=Actinomyces respiraculi TaxID=2744574 RepID=A0A7T0LN95_9ACTO|nr:MULTISPECIES: type II toxin-antitoxin system VapC family toxin [Actinomyces]QPL06318.1 type II toxin-antitoxin system VapC family toxin [Actinomyces respiraculi]
MTWYLDTSAALKLLVEETESAVLAQRIDEENADLVSALLLETELRRAASRNRRLTQGAVTEFLDGVSLYDMPRSLYTEAGLVGGGSLRSLDALHLTAAIRCGATSLLTYDKRLIDSARDMGVHVLAPGAGPALDGG